MKKNVFVLGVGRFGLAAAQKLIEKNVSVTVIDNDEKRINESNIREKSPNILILDTSNYEQLASTSIANADHVIVAISDVESSIMTCVNLKDLGITNITAKVRNDLHKKVLTSLGIKDIVFPEQVIGTQVARQILSYHNDINYIYNGDSLTLVCIRLNNDNLIDRPLREFKNDQAFNIFAIKHNKPMEPIIMNPSDDYKLQKLDRIFVTIRNEELKNIKKYFGEIVNKK